jgi:hypothetical protein
MSTTVNFIKTRTASQKLTSDLVKQEQVLDFAQTGMAAIAGEKVGCIVIPKGAMLLNASVTIITASSAAGSTATMGDETSDENVIGTTLSPVILLDAVANTTVFSLPGDIIPALGGKLYTADTMLSLKLDGGNAQNATTGLKLAVCAEYFILSAVANA